MRCKGPRATSVGLGARVSARSDVDFLNNYNFRTSNAADTFSDIWKNLERVNPTKKLGSQISLAELTRFLVGKNMSNLQETTT